MKIGIRKPNIKKRIKARTTGKIKRKVKSNINPLYGKKGVGYIKNPKRTIKQKIYNKTTISTDRLIKRTGNIFMDLFIIFPILCIDCFFIKFPMWLYQKFIKK